MKYSLVHSTLGKEEKQVLHDVIESDRLTMGRHVKEFEKAFADYFQMNYAVMTQSGSSANLISIASLFYRKDNPLRRGDEVIVPSIAWATTYYPLHQYGLRLRIVDIDLKTLNYDLEELKKAIHSKTKMIVAVSILGNPAPLKEIEELCKENNLLLMEDNCESMGAEIHNRYTGTFGLVNTFSSFFSHQISTIEGGMVTTNDKEIYNLLLSLRNHGWTRDQEKDSPLFERKKEDFYEAYRFILPGYNVRPTELQGALGIPQLKKLESFISTRRKNARVFQELFQGDSRFILQKENGKSSWFAFTMIVDPELNINRSTVLEKLKSAGIEYRMITGGNILEHDVVRHFDYICSRSTYAKIAHNRGFFLGNHPVDMRENIEYLYKTLKEI